MTRNTVGKPWCLVSENAIQPTSFTGPQPGAYPQSFPVVNMDVPHKAFFQRNKGFGAFNAFYFL